jgi:hypothetical protein
VKKLIAPLLLALSMPVFAGSNKKVEVIDYTVPGSKAPHVRTVINHSTGRVDTYQGVGRAADGRVTGTQAQRVHAVTAGNGQTVYYRTQGGNTLVNGGHVPRGGGAMMGMGGGGGSYPSGGGGQINYKN